MGGRDDRRDGDRIPVNEELAGVGATWVSNLSLGGVFVHTSEPLAVGSPIQLRFSLLLDDPVVIAALGKVVRHSRQPLGMGVQFTRLEPLMRARIEAVLERQKPIDSGAPLRLPEPSGALGLGAKPLRPPRPSVDEDDATRTHRVVFARPAPVGGLSFSTSDDAPEAAPEFEEDAKTALFPSLSLPRRAEEDEPTTMFQAPRVPPKDT